jgi:hypothetical protein
MLKASGSRKTNSPDPFESGQDVAAQDSNEFACNTRECEDRLDDLFERHELQTAEQDLPVPPSRELSPIDALRQTFIDELIPVVNELREKYAPKGLNLQMNAERFLGGKREIVIEIQFERVGMRYNGTVIDGAIAFSQTRYDDEDRSGLTASGAALRTRGLNAERFRAFLCDRIAHVVQQASKRRR